MTIPDAVIARVRTDAALTVFDGSAPDTSPVPYVVVYVSTDYEVPTTLQDRTDRAWWRVTTHSVGANMAAARIIAARVRATLLDHRLVVDDVQTWKIRHSEGLPAQVDESTGARVVDVVDVWTFQTSPSSG